MFPVVQSRGRTEPSFFVPKADIAAKGYDLSLNRYREVVQETVSYTHQSKSWMNSKRWRQKFSRDWRGFARC